MNQPTADLALEPSGPTPRRRSRRVLLATALLGVLALAALLVSNGGGTDPDRTTTDDLALAGVQAPAEASAGKSVGGRSGAEKVVGTPAAKGGAAATSTTARASTTSAALAALAAARAVTTTTGRDGSPGTTTSPTTTGAPTAGARGGGTTATTTLPTPSTTRPATGGGTFTPSGAVYWLATDGDDAAAGSESTPWRTFGSAVRRLRAGDTLYVKGGTYGSTTSGTAIDVAGMNGAAGAPITIAAAPGQPVHLIGSGWQVVYVQNSTYIDIRGFEVSSTAAIDRADTNGIEILNSHHVRAIGNTVHDVGGGGISTNHSNHVTIDGNRVYNTSNWSGYQTSAISLFESTNIGGGNNGDGFSFYIRNNVAWNNKTLVGAVSDGNCIIVDSNRYTNYSGATSITNNLCYANGGRGVHVFVADNVVAVNNTLVGNLTSSQMFDSGELSAIQAGNITFRNNLVIPGRDGNGTAEYATTGVTYTRNLYVGRAPTHRGTTDLVVSDPQVGSDYVPLAGSPAIDAGTGDGAPATDRRGRPRTGAPDIGCYEA